MTDEQWEGVRERVVAQFALVGEGTEALDGVPDGWLSYLEFDGPAGRMRVELVTKPRTLGERARTSRRVGASVAVEKVYDAGDIVRFLRVYRWELSANGWVAIDAAGFVS